METQEMTSVPVNQLFLIKVSFDPDGLPNGAVDATDLAYFLSGMQLVLDGLTGPERPFTPDLSHHQQFAIVGYQAGTAEFFLTLESLLVWVLNHPIADVVASGGYLLVKFLESYVSELGSGLAKEHVPAAQATLDTAAVTLTRFMQVMRQVVAGVHFPVFQKDIRSGLKQMAQVGEKTIYNPQGIQMSDNVEPTAIITFDSVTSASILTVLARSEGIQRQMSARSDVEVPEVIEAVSSKGIKRQIEAREVVERTGVIKAASRIDHTFTLAVPSSQRMSHTKCVCPPHLDDLVGTFYSSGERVRVVGTYHYQTAAGRNTTRRIVDVTDIQPAGGHLPLP